MLFYLGMYFIILIILTIPFNGTIKGKKFYLDALIPLFILFLIFGLRKATGVDDLTYEKLFSIANNSMSWIIDYYGIEQSYIFVSKIVALFGFNHQMVFLIYAFFSFVFIFLSLKELCEDKVELVLAISSFMAFCFIMTITVMRQFLSCTIILYSVALLIKNKTTKSFIMILLASIIHSGAIVCLSIHFLVMTPKKISTKLKIIMPIVALLLGSISGFANNAIYSVITVFFNKYIYIFTSDFFGATQKRGILNFVLLLVYYTQFAFRFTYKPKRLKESHSTDLMERGEMIFLSSFYATISMGWINRSSMYYMMFIMFFFITLYRSVTGKKDKVLLTALSFSFISLYFVYAFYHEQLNLTGVIPYSGNINIFIK